MTTITAHQAKTHLSRYLADIEKGKRFVIARRKSPVAMLDPIKRSKRKRRPKAGDIKGAPFEFPASAFAPLTDKELRVWGP